MVLVPEKCEGCCQGVDGWAGLNLACEGCERAVATRMDDCGLWQTVFPGARRGRTPPLGAPRCFAARLGRAGHRVPPVEPDGSWSRRWEAAIGVALATSWPPLRAAP
ncbi:C2H2-type domain-containing protein OS=Streptomyces rimosus subsp. rimosus (strain ATCC/ DSM 40260 / JCM 4667 / NRRL 2234) OX=1265868 GN=SRIM_039845 PE=4 SV=1 [Streptomyces rimosus subsp. rimosus]